jgi:hypothetical protein
LGLESKKDENEGIGKNERTGKVPKFSQLKNYPFDSLNYLIERIIKRINDQNVTFIRLKYLTGSQPYK